MKSEIKKLEECLNDYHKDSLWDIDTPISNAIRLLREKENPTDKFKRNVYTWMGILLFCFLFFGMLMAFRWFFNAEEDKWQQMPSCIFSEIDYGHDSETGEKGEMRRFFLCDNFIKNK